MWKYFLYACMPVSSAIPVDHVAMCVSVHSAIGYEQEIQVVHALKSELYINRKTGVSSRKYIWYWEPKE